MNLVIVESPAKARKLKSYLGDKFEIEASVGHIRDLPKKELGVDVEDNFEPTYVIVYGKKKVVNELRKLAKKAEKIYLAMDPDREGEAIAWHVKNLLAEKLPADKKDIFARATFHAITKTNVAKAIENPGKLNSDLIDAQQARRILDRLVGYKVSPVLWKKVRRNLSAGRVQSPALRLIVEKEREIEAFEPDEYWELDVALSAEDKKPKTYFEDNKPLDDLPEDILISRVYELDGEKYEPTSEKDVTGVVKALKKSDYKVKEVEKKERRRWSLPPFITSTLQQQAAHRLHMTSKQTMSLAQHLYEEGLITYHRTDSVNLSKQALGMARKHIKAEYGEKYLPKKTRVFKSKSKNAQEAHEAIRVTDLKLKPDQVPGKGKKLGKRHQQLYDLIWRRFVASQMEKAVYDQTRINIEAKPQEKTDSFKTAGLKANGSVLKFDGWMKLFPSGSDTFLPDLDEGQPLNYLDMSAAQKFTQPPARYNDASLVKELEKKGIGRPSTYASIISVLENRTYVERDDRRFKPTVIGTTVNDFLVKNFDEIVDYDFTAEMEEDLDRIARGEKEWRKIITDFYKPFAKNIEDVIENADRAKIPVEKTDRVCPDCHQEEGGKLVIRTGRYGKFYSCDRFPDCKYTENYTEKLEGYKCALCGEKEGGEVVIKNTRGGSTFYGCSRYPDCDWASWKKPKKGETVTLEEWAEIQAKREARKKKRKKKKINSKKSKKK